MHSYIQALLSSYLSAFWNLASRSASSNALPPCADQQTDNISAQYLLMYTVLTRETAEYAFFDANNLLSILHISNGTLL